MTFSRASLAFALLLASNTQAFVPAAQRRVAFVARFAAGIEDPASLDPTASGDFSGSNMATEILPEKKQQQQREASLPATGDNSGSQSVGAAGGGVSGQSDLGTSTFDPTAGGDFTSDGAVSDEANKDSTFLQATQASQPAPPDPTSSSGSQSVGTSRQSDLGSSSFDPTAGGDFASGSADSGARGDASSPTTQASQPVPPAPTSSGSQPVGGSGDGSQSTTVRFNAKSDLASSSFDPTASGDFASGGESAATPSASSEATQAGQPLPPVLGDGDSDLTSGDFDPTAGGDFTGGN